MIATGPTLVQYWRSSRISSATPATGGRAPAGLARVQPAHARRRATSGIWHETYRVRAGEYEAIYGNMPRVGLAAVGDLVPIGSTSATAAQRIGARPDDRAPVAGY